MTTDADDRYLDSIADDCRTSLGPGVELLSLTRSYEAPLKLTLRYRLDGWDAVSEVAGDTLLEAHVSLRQQLVEDRLRLGFSVMADSRPPSRRTAVFRS